jgi:hypothetical protein
MSGFSLVQRSVQACGEDDADDGRRRSAFSWAIVFPKSPNSASRLKAIQIDEQDGEEFLDEVKSDMLKATPDR